MLRDILKKLPVGASIAARRQDFYNRFRQLQADGKYHVIREYGSCYGLKTLIETGTYLGDMLAANADNFDRLISIELSPDLFNKAKERFSGIDKIELKCGNSAELLPEILREIREPCLFWLDAHYSGGNTGRGDLDTPIMKELHSILTHPVKEHVILIDDARCFGVTKDYPSISEIERFLTHSRFFRPLFVKDDIIRILPQQTFLGWVVGKAIRWSKSGFLSN